MAKLGVLPVREHLTPHPELRGVFVGGCVARGVGSKFRAVAHAHTTGVHRGWICFRSRLWLHVRALWLHELAHIVTRSGHTPRWRLFLIQIGGTLDPVHDNGKLVLQSYWPKRRNEAVRAVAAAQNGEVSGG